ncbi:CG15545, partial [Drosophila busckii]
RSFHRRSRSYFSSVGPPDAVRLIAKGPAGYRSDLQTNESKRREVSSKYAKKTHYRPYNSEEDDYSSERYSSAEYSGEAPQDSREYTIGTQIRVQHPITIPKKASSSSNYAKPPKYVTAVPYKSAVSTVYGGDFSSGEERAPAPPPSPPKRSKWTQPQYAAEPDPFHLVPPPKTTAASSNHAYRVFEPDHDDYEVPRPTRPKNYERYKTVASKKQIEAYLEDQQKLLDEAIQRQLLNNPKLKKFLKNDSQESRPDLDLEDFETFPPNFNAGNSFNAEHTHLQPPKGSRPHRRPGLELKRSPKTHILKPKRKYRSTALVINV